jgi:type IV pilus assembly protein PilW
MVGLTLGMIGMLIVSKVLDLNSGRQATISATGEAQSMGNLSLYTIERELKQAGFGISSPALLGCQLNGYDNIRSILISKTLYPVEITAAVSASDSDSLTVAYGTSQTRMGPLTLVATYGGDAADIDVQNRFGLAGGDFFLLGQVNPVTPCVLGQISSIPPTSTTAIAHAPTYPFNKNGGLGTTFNANSAEFYDLGRSFNYNNYSVNSGKQLIQQSMLTGNSLVISDNVQGFKIRYGHDSDGNGTVDTWDTTIPTTPAEWSATTNVRMGLAIKNPKREGAVVTASPLSLWPNGPSITLSAEDQHYRYRTYNVVVPLRNMIWRTF